MTDSRNQPELETLDYKPHKDDRGYGMDLIPARSSPATLGSKNEDTEIWRKIIGDYYSPSIHLTKKGEIGINVGGKVYIRSVENWHELASNVLPATLRMNSHVIKPEHSECEHNWLDRGFIVEKCSKCGALNTTQDTINKAETDLSNLPGREHHKDCECGNCPDQPNLKIIGEIEGLISQVNEKLYQLPETKIMKCQLTLRGKALEEIDLFQKTTLYELKKIFKD